MTSSIDLRDVEQLLVTWNSLRVTEIYRRNSFTTRRETALTRWNERAPHNAADEHFIEFRLARGVTALSEVMEFEDRNTHAYETCRSELERAATLEGKERLSTLAKIREIASRAIRQDMRYLATLTSTFQYELDELVEFIDERESDSFK